MDEFEKWADDCDESDEKYYAIPVGSVARIVAKAAWEAGREAGMREAAERCDELWKKWYDKYGGNSPFDAGYVTGLQNADTAILSAIGGGK